MEKVATKTLASVAVQSEAGSVRGSSSSSSSSSSYSAASHSSLSDFSLQRLAFENELSQQQHLLKELQNQQMQLQRQQEALLGLQTESHHTQAQLDKRLEKLSSEVPEVGKEDGVKEGMQLFLQLKRQHDDLLALQATQAQVHAQTQLELKAHMEDLLSHGRGFLRREEGVHNKAGLEEEEDAPPPPPPQNPPPLHITALSLAEAANAASEALKERLLELHSAQSQLFPQQKRLQEVQEDLIKCTREALASAAAASSAQSITLSKRHPPEKGWSEAGQEEDECPPPPPPSSPPPKTTPPP